MGNLVHSLHILNKGIIQVMESTNYILPVVEEKVTHKVRLVEDVVNLTSRGIDSSAYITAHNLAEYRNKVYSIDLVDNVSCWLDVLLEF